jgi:hypothetical protein
MWKVGIRNIVGFLRANTKSIRTNYVIQTGLCVMCCAARREQEEPPDNRVRLPSSAPGTR